MNPSTMALLSVGSSAVSGFGQIEQSRAQAASDGYSAKVAAQNADIEKQNAGFAGAEGEANAGTQGIQNRAKVGATLASEGASGITVGKGSFADVRTSEQMQGKLDAMQIRSNAARQAYGFQTLATSYENQAALDRAQQGYDKQAGILNASATVMGGAGKAAMYSNFLNKTGPVPDFSDVSFTGENQY